MIHYKTSEEIEKMRQGGQILRKVVTDLIPRVEVGMTTLEIDEISEKLIKQHGAEPSFKRVKGYNWSTCLPINEQVVHTPPSNRKLKKGDIITIDIGAYYEGFHTDWATTLYMEGEAPDEKILKFLEVGQQALKQALEKVAVDVRMGEISRTVQSAVYENGYFILRELTGHGIGHELHEDPYVPGYLEKPIEKTLQLKPGLVLAVEVIYSMGTEEIAYEKGNDWSVVTRDGSLSACFEETIAITENKCFILT